MSTSPIALTATQIDVLFANLRGVRDGDADSIHDARVATRRLRELLRLAAVEAGESARPAYELVRSAGRALGKVREVDSLISLCDGLMTVQPTVAGAVAMIRGRLIQERHQAARRLVKKLEALDLDGLRDVTRGIGRGALVRNAGMWRAALSDRIRRRGGKLAAAVERASGVYFPNRLHQVRIELKKLRYLTEIAEQTRAWRPAHLRHDAEQLQGVLGDLHDRQVLLDRFESSDADPALVATLRADIAHRHAQYLARRERLHLMAAACERYAAEQARWRRALLSGAVVALLLPAAGLAVSGHTPSGTRAA